ncbi:hypothetical protein YC2023_076238 [Brassica napus]
MHLSLPKSFDPGIGEGDGRPNKSERLKESQGQHLTCPQNVEEDARNNESTQATKEQITLQLAETIWVKVTINNFLIPDAPPYHKTTSRRPYQYRGVVLTFQLKEDPPDLPPKIKPRKYQGKALESQKRMKPDLFYLGTGYTVSRSKPFQEIGYDIGTGTTPEPGANRMHHSANRRTNQHMCFIKTAYLINQEEFCHETNFNAFYTQQRVRKNYNNCQHYSDQEDINFTNWRFPSPSICEYPSLKVVSSPINKRSDQKQLMDFKADLLVFQQAKNQEKRPRKYEVMAQSQKPAKPALHLPKMEDPGLTSNQTQFWKSGDFSQIQDAL